MMEEVAEAVEAVVNDELNKAQVEIGGGIEESGLDEQVEAEEVQKLKSKRADRAFPKEFESFLKCTNTDGKEWMNREVIDDYFTSVVAKRMDHPSNAKRVQAALQWYADQQSSGFDVGSLQVSEALERQKDVFARSELDKYLHEGPTLSNEDSDTILKAMIVHVNWQDFVVSFVLGNSACIKFDTSKQLRFVDLKPPKFTQNLLEPSYLTIKNDSQIIGAHRHRNYRQCPIGILAMVVWLQLRDNTSIHFFAEPESSSWKELRLIQNWKLTKTAVTEYQSLLEGIDTAHLCQNTIGHIIRKTAAAENDTPPNLSKVVRMLKTPSQSAMHILAGFKPGEAYYVPRTNLHTQFTSEELEAFLFPRLSHWRSQISDPEADQFLNGLLPFFCQVIAQDGIYWLHDFPSHEISLTIRNVMPGKYMDWAEQMRAELAVSYPVSLQQISGSNTENYMAHFQKTAQQAFFTILGELRALREKTASLETRLAAIQQEVKRSGGGDALFQEIQPQAAVLMANSSAPPESDGLGVAPSSATDNVPTIPRKLPDTMTQLLVEHDDLFRLEQYRHVKKRHWKSWIQNAYSRRGYLYDKLVERGSSTSKRQAAAEMDLEMKAERLTNCWQYYEYLKERDPNTRRRKKRTAKEIESVALPPAAPSQIKAEEEENNEAESAVVV